MFCCMELRYFLKLANKRERAEVAEVCHGSVSYLYQIAGSHRHASPLMATRIELATQHVAKETNGRLQAVPRESLVKHPEIFAGLGDTLASYWADSV